MSHVPNPEIEEILARLAALKPSEQLQVMTRFGAGLLNAAVREGHSLPGGMESHHDAIDLGSDHVPPPRVSGGWEYDGTTEELIEEIRAGRSVRREPMTW